MCFSTFGGPLCWPARRTVRCSPILAHQTLLGRDRTKFVIKRFGCRWRSLSSGQWKCRCPLCRLLLVGSTFSTGQPHATTLELPPASTSSLVLELPEQCPIPHLVQSPGLGWIMNITSSPLFTFPSIPSWPPGISQGHSSATPPLLTQDNV